MVTEAYIKLRRTGSGKARTDSSEAGKPVRDIVANSQDTGPRGRAGAGRDLRRKGSVWPLAHGPAQRAVGSLLACMVAAAVYLAYTLVVDNVGGALLPVHCFVQHALELSVLRTATQSH